MLEPPATRSPGLHGDLPFGAEEDIHARAEFDEADALAFRDVVAEFLIEDDAARDESGDLGERDAAFRRPRS